MIAGDQFGIGGYYMIIRSEHSFGPGKADTTITAKWVAQVEDAAAQEALSDAPEEPSKCPADSASRSARTESAGALSNVADALVGAVTAGTTPTP